MGAGDQGGDFSITQVFHLSGDAPVTFGDQRDEGWAAIAVGEAAGDPTTSARGPGRCAADGRVSQPELAWRGGALSASFVARGPLLR